MKVSEIMTRGVVCVSSEMNLMEAWKILSEHRISGAPVLDSSGSLVGLISQTDIVKEALAGENSHIPDKAFYLGMPFMDTQIFHSTSEALSGVTVNKIMSREVISVSSNVAVSTVAKLMRANRIHRIMVIDSDKISGIISSFDLLQILE